MRHQNITHPLSHTAMVLLATSLFALATPTRAQGLDALEPRFPTPVVNTLPPYTAYPNGPKLIPLPQTDGTTMLLGDNHGEYPSEKPTYRVLINYNLSIGQTEVTRAHWQTCVDDDACAPLPDAGIGAGNKPATNVSFRDDAKKNDVTTYLIWLNKITRIDINSAYRFRLPTEAEWEYAARAGSRGNYSFGANNDTPLSAQSVNVNNHNSGTQAVGSYPANKWQLHDLHGNVSEWVADCFDSANYAERAIAVGGWRADTLSEGSQTSLSCARTFRGGGWNDYTHHVRSALRFGFVPHAAHDSLGFRLARTMPP